MNISVHELHLTSTEMPHHLKHHLEGHSITDRKVDPNARVTEVSSSCEEEDAKIATRLGGLQGVGSKAPKGSFPMAVTKSAEWLRRV